MTQVIRVRAAAGDYDVHVGPRLLATLGERVHGLFPKARIALVTDSNVRYHWGAAAQQSLEAKGFAVTVLEVPAGEASKSLEVANGLWGALIEKGFSRSDLVVALGGGVVGDLAGFVAATFHRGMPFVQVPTSLLAQVDSSVGGKVAIDHAKGKNLVGAFHAPRLVLADTDVLKTLPPRERWCGLAELVKAAFIRDRSLLTTLEAHLENLVDGSAPDGMLEDVIAAAIRVKAEIVSQDEKESGPRLLLNFGHTLAHGLEAASGYGPLTHGEAVVVGMRAAFVASHRLGKLPEDELQKALALLRRFPAPPKVTLEKGAVLRAVGWDKKAVGGKVRFIVLERLGRAAVEPELPRALLEELVGEAVHVLAGGEA